jgi:hypothetical protein
MQSRGVRQKNLPVTSGGRVGRQAAEHKPLKTADLDFSRDVRASGHFLRNFNALNGDLQRCQIAPIAENNSNSI